MGGVESTAENRKQVWAPASFARGFCALTDDVEVQYKCTGTYNGKAESAIRWDDPETGIEWPVKQAIVSEKDRKAQVAPLNVYGNTKVAGEAFLCGLAEKHFIVRTSALYGKSPCRAKGGKNFVDLMLKLAGERDELRVVDDEIVRPTSTVELAKQVVILSQSNDFGLYHATAEGNCNWYEFAKTIFQETNNKVTLNIAKPGEFPAKVPRPKYSVLENAQQKKRGLNVFSSWKYGLRTYLFGDGHHLQAVGI